jgi:lipopolysaccharide/colanic/teichoic acid biosynthesis glycosyltransferase
VIKRLFDIVFATAGLAMSAPAWLVCAALIKLEDGGPIFFRQGRVGQNGYVFDALKFRSMIVDAESGVGALQATHGDRRVTRVGRIMRATALDELPQLWNILRGDMSVVGPRPLRPGEIERRGDGTLVPLERVPNYRERHRVRPGLTGLAQVYAPRDARRTTKFRFDLLYIRRASFWLDMKLVMLSFWISGRGRWEHAPHERALGRPRTTPLL